MFKKDSFWDDFNFSRIRRSLSTTYEEGKLDKEKALEKVTSGTKEKDKQVLKDANRLLWGFVREQWLKLLIALPFMFLGNLIIFLTPSYVGRIFDQMTAQNAEG